VAARGQGAEVRRGGREDVLVVEIAPIGIDVRDKEQDISIPEPARSKAETTAS
jgi:hypothetical protein